MCIQTKQIARTGLAIKHDSQNHALIFRNGLRRWYEDWLPRSVQIAFPDNARSVLERVWSIISEVDLDIASITALLLSFVSAVTPVELSNGVNLTGRG